MDGKYRLVLRMAVGSLTLIIALPGCNNQASFAQPNAKTPETGSAGKNQRAPRDAITTQETPAGIKRQDNPREIAVDIGHGVKFEMVLVVAGEFMMGAPESDGHAKGDEDCQRFCDGLNTRSHPVGKFKLPTEAQWEYACRADNSTSYCFGNEVPELSAYAWFFENSHLPSHPVGGKMPNARRLYDMHGNLCEWCQDCYDRGYYADSPTDDPAGPLTGSERAFRGGSWNMPARMCRSACRSDGDPACHNYLLGMRVCLVPADK